MGAGGERDGYIARKGTKKLVRHPRGGRVMFSSDTVHDVNENFPLRSHSCLLRTSYLPRR
jgi:hypothetical protein